MKTVNVLIDTSIVNRILGITKAESSNFKEEEDRRYLSRIIKDYVKKGLVCLIVNPSVKREIEQTPDSKKKAELLALFNQLNFTPYNNTAFTFTFPAHFVTEEEKRMLGEICARIRGFGKDKKIFLDALANPEIHVLLTTDRKHLADKGLDIYGKPIFTPRQLFEYLHNKTRERNIRNNMGKVPEERL